MACTRSGYTSIGECPTIQEEGEEEEPDGEDEDNDSPPAELTDQDLQDLHEDILDRNDDGVRSIIKEFIEQDLPVDRLCCTEVELEPAAEDHHLNQLPLTAFHRAALIESHGIIDAILSALPDLDINLRLKANGYTSLHLASAAGVLPVVNYLTSPLIHANVDGRDNRGRSAVHLAAENNQKDVIALLCVRGASVSVTDDLGRTPLHLASEKGHLEVVDCLLARNADINAKTLSGDTALHLAQLDNHVTTTERLLDRGAQVNQDNQKGNTAMHEWIIAYGLRDERKQGAPASSSLSVLLSRGADVNKPNHQGDISLHLATKGGHIILVHVLVNQNANLNALNKTGRSPLFYAENSEICELLLENGAQVDIRDNSGNSLLHVAASDNDKSLKVLEILLTEGIDVNAQDKLGQTALHLACSAGSKEKTEILLKQGASNELLDMHDSSVLHAALSNNHLDLSMWLLQANNINIHQVDAAGNSLLHLAAQTGSLNVVQYLVSRKAPLGVLNSDKKTAATMGGENGYLEVTRVLLVHGASISKEVGAKVLLEFVRNQDHEAVKCIVKQTDPNSFYDPKNNSALHLALAHFQQDIVECLLDNNASIECVNSDCQTPLHSACITTNKTAYVIKRLISTTNCCLQDTSGKTALHYAIGDCDMEILILFIENDFDINIQDNIGRSILHTILDSKCLDKEEKVSYLLLNAKPDINLTDSRQQTYLHLAVLEQELECCMLLLDNSADVDCPDINKQTPLHHACRLGDTKMASMLLRYKASLEPVDMEGRTALFSAVGSDNSELCVLLMDSGANVDHQNNDGQTALMHALKEGRSQICLDILSQSTPDLRVQDRDGSTLLHFGARFSTPEVVKELLTLGADVNVLDHNQRSALYSVVHNTDWKILKLLVAGGSDLLVADCEGKTVLHYAAGLGGYDHINILMDQSLDIDMKDNRQRTAMHCAAFVGDCDVIELLVANEASLDVTDIHGNTPLMMGISRGHTEVSQMMVEQGAEVKTRNRHGDTSLHLAMRMDTLDRSLLKLLCHHGRSCLDKINQAGKTPVDILLGRSDLDALAVALDIGLDV